MPRLLNQEEMILVGGGCVSGMPNVRFTKADFNKADFNKALAREKNRKNLRDRAARRPENR